MTPLFICFCFSLIRSHVATSYDVSGFRAALVLVVSLVLMEALVER